LHTWGQGDGRQETRRQHGARTRGIETREARLREQAVFVHGCVCHNLIDRRTRPNPGRNSCATRRKMGSASPKSKTFNVKVLSHAYSLISNDFSCNRRYHAEGAVRHAAWGIRTGLESAVLYQTRRRHRSCAGGAQRAKERMRALYLAPRAKARCVRRTQGPSRRFRPRRPPISGPPAVGPSPPLSRKCHQQRLELR